ncbi:MAG TPA: diguanylate cyclase, partial [Synergistetes bacterium]|nr:diguanylate cyclase [Synergistota bacterium]
MLSQKDFLMNSQVLVLALSLLFQTTATLMALRLLVIARRHPSVLFIATAGILMLFRRLRMLLLVISGNALSPFFLIHESLGLAVSIFLLVSAWWAVPRLLGLLRTRDDLAEKHSTASHIIKDLAIPAFVIDKDHRITHWNSACERLTGIPATEMIGSSEPWRAFYDKKRPVLADFVVDSSGSDRVKEFYGDSASMNENTERGWNAEFFLPKINGGRWLFFTAVPLYGPEGSVIGAIETFLDRTEEKKKGLSLSKSASRLRALHEIVRELTREEDILPLMERTVRLLDREMSITNVSIVENTSREKGTVFTPRIIASTSIDPSEYDIISDRIRMSGKGLSVKAGVEKRMIVTPNVNSSPDFFPFVEESLSEIDIPILDGERVLGVISVEGYAPLDNTDEELFDILAGHLSSLWKNIELIKKMESMALTDTVTGIPNRRALLQRLEEEENRLSRSGGRNSVIMLDMNRFKEVNDTYGHFMGDAALKAATETISSSLRGCDFVARFGGDEFAIILPDTGEAEVKVAIERITQGLRDLRVKGIPMNLSAEFGLACYP